MNFADEQLAIDTASPAELHALQRLALGRLFRLGSRPEQEGDMRQYEDVRRIIMLCAERLNGVHPMDVADKRPNIVRHSRYLGRS